MPIRILAVLALVSASAIGAPGDSLIVHEWGTFTSFQDDQGRTIGAINVDDEPVPRFVHRLKDLPIFSGTTLPALWSQGAPRCHPDVTLRLETPVIYFYPPRDAAIDAVDVRATFNAGWITEFYPLGDAGQSQFPRALDSETHGSIEWHALRLGGVMTAMPRTSEHVWLAPRNVRSTLVTSSNGETEKYLFYRGVAHLDAPILARHRRGALAIELRAPDAVLPHLPRLWIVDVESDGRLQYRTVDPIAVSARVDLSQASGTHTSLESLQNELRQALIQQGLYEDEAHAMLATWQLSYFKTEGLRVFFLLPQAWTDSQLPLSISSAAHTTRVMMGRLELISDRQRAALQKLYELPDDALPTQPLYYEAPSILKEMRNGARTHSDLYRVAGRQAPKALEYYERLGRFRDALLMHELGLATDTSKRARLNAVMNAFSACTWVENDE